jgi:hypothetical protein
VATKPKKVGEREFNFTLVLDGITELTSEVENALYEGGCDDGTLGFQCGRPYMTFSRTAPNFAEAILSAVRDVEKAVPGLDVLRVDYCDLVTQAEIARLIKRSRQAVHQLITGRRGPGLFPPPIYRLTDDTTKWAWSDVVDWLAQNNLVEEETASDTIQAALINDLLDFRSRRRRDRKTADKALRMLGIWAELGRLSSAPEIKSRPARGSRGRPGRSRRQKEEEAKQG